MDRKLEIFVVAGFVLVQLTAPMVLGEFYPFTVSPMFSDQPSQYSVYEIFDEAGHPIAAEKFGLHLNYDGNPVGLGMGIAAPPTLHEFGQAPSLDEIKAHVQRQLAKMPPHRAVTLRRTHVSCRQNQVVEVTHEIHIQSNDTAASE